jgi:hypothetical protein
MAGNLAPVDDDLVACPALIEGDVERNDCIARAMIIALDDERVAKRSILQVDGAVGRGNVTPEGESGASTIRGIGEQRGVAREVQRREGGSGGRVITSLRGKLPDVEA